MDTTQLDTTRLDTTRLGPSGAQRRPDRRPAPPAVPLTPAQRAMRFALARWWIVAAGALAVIGVFIAATFAGNVPLPAAVPAAQSSTVYAADGSTLAAYHGTEDRTIVPLDQISKNLQQAVVAAEDRTFYTDSGFSLRGTLRALMVDLRGGQVAQGGSTITQQYVRNVFAEVGRQRTVSRKIKEALLAVKFARKYSKKEILGDYLNTVYFGRGAYGAQAAAKAYFNVPASDLTVGAAAYLAGIIRSPSGYQPDTNPAGPAQIRDTVLSDMVQTRAISADQSRGAKGQPLPFVSDTTKSASGAYFVEYVRRALESKPYSFTDREILTGGLKIYTTLDPGMQAAAENAVASTLDSPTDPQAALVSMATDGSIRAMVGGRDVTSRAAAQGFNFATQQTPGAGRQAGSSFKPFTLAAFLQAGYSIKSMFQAPVKIQVTSKQCQNLDGSNWSVTNFNNESFPNDLDITQATANSVNTVYAQMIDKLGPRTVAATAQSIGGWSNLAPVCSLTLGTSAVTPLEMARAYATFAAQGQRPDPLAVTKVVAPNGQVLFDNAPHSTQVLDANMANTINSVLSQVLVNGTASGKGIGRPAAGKTGTTENLVDAWFVGYTPGISTAVWMGYTNKNKSGQVAQLLNVHGVPSVTGGTLPATIWQKYMKAALAGTPSQSFVAPTIVGKIIGPSGAPCPGNTQPTADFPCLPPGSLCAPASVLLPATTPDAVTATASPDPSPIRPAPSPSPVGRPTPTGPAFTPIPRHSSGPTPAPTSTDVQPGTQPTSVPTPCPTPSQVLPPDIIIPSPGASPSPAAPPAHALGGQPTWQRDLAAAFLDAG